MKKKDILKLLDGEIEWCKKNPQKIKAIWRDGFIQGIKQSKRLIKKYNSTF